VRPSSELQRSLAQVAKAYEAQLDEATVSYLAARSVSESAARTFHLGLVTDPAPGHDMFVGRLSIPYVTPMGARTIKFRCLEDHDCGEVGCPKYLGLAGAKPRMFNAMALIEGPPVVAVCEGELDAIVCSSRLVPAVGIPGVSSWLPHFPRMFAGTPRVLVLVDNDEKLDGRNPGRELAERVARDVEQAEVIPPPKGLDLTEWIQAEGLDAVRKGIGL
jgi:hypothetical protein